MHQAGLEMPATSTQLPEIYDYIYVPLYKTRAFKIWFIVGIFLLLVLASIATYFLIKKIYQKRKLLPWEQAIKDLKKLNLTSCKSKSDFKKFYFSLTKIVRKYICKRFDRRMAGRSDGFVIDVLKEEGFDSEFQKKVEVLFEGSVTVRFADEVAALEQAERDLGVAVELVERTVPNEEPGR